MTVFVWVYKENYFFEHLFELVGLEGLEIFLEKFSWQYKDLVHLKNLCEFKAVFDSHEKALTTTIEFFIRGHIPTLIIIFIFNCILFTVTSWVDILINLLVSTLNFILVVLKTLGIVMALVLKMILVDFLKVSLD